MLKVGLLTIFLLAVVAGTAGFHVQNSLELHYQDSKSYNLEESFMEVVADADIDQEEVTLAETEAETEIETEDVPLPIIPTQPAVDPIAVNLPTASPAPATPSPNDPLPATPGAAAVTPINGVLPAAPVVVQPKPELILDDDDKARVAYNIIHDGRAGSIKPLLPARKGEVAANTQLANIEIANRNVAKDWERRADDEIRAEEARANLALKAQGLLPPPVKFVIAGNGKMKKRNPFVWAGSDKQDAAVGAGCAKKTGTEKKAAATAATPVAK